MINQNPKMLFSLLVYVHFFYFGLAEKLNKILPKTLEVYCDSHCKRSSTETHFLSIALLDWTIKQKRQNRDMGYVCVFALSVKCEASHNNIVKVDFFSKKRQ